MICLRLDLDYVPWDSANAEKYGHGEPAMVLKLLDFARKRGVKYHFFISNRSLRTFSTIGDAILGEGHDLDWLTHYPDDEELYTEAKQLFSLAGHTIEGVAVTKPWTQDLFPTWLGQIQFVSGPDGPSPLGVQFFPERGRFDDEELPFGLGQKHDIELAQLAQEPEDIKTLVASPQVLAKNDLQLRHLNLIASSHIPIITLRDAAKIRSATSLPQSS